MKRNIAVFFIVIFTALISAPTIIVSIDDSVDTSIFFNVTEEEEKVGLKLLFEITSQDLDGFFSDQVGADNVAYTYKKYPKPHLNLISPPPEFIL